MARTSVTTQQIVRTGLAANLTGPVIDGDIIDSGNVILYVKNDSGAPVTVTVQTGATYQGYPVGDQTVSVPAAGFRFIGPLPAGTFNQPTDAAVGAGRVLVDYSAVTSVTRAVLSF